MEKVLVIDVEPLICDIVTICFQEYSDTGVDCALNESLGAQKLRETHYDLAIIGGKLLELSGMALAEIAANENTPVLVLSGHPGLLQNLRTFGYPCLEKPFSMSLLLSESKRVIAETSENIRRVKATAARMQAHTEALKAAMLESQRLIRGIVDKG